MSTSESSFDLLSKEDLLAVKLSGIFTQMEVPILRELATLLYGTFGGNSSDAKPEEPTTQPSTRETGIMVPSNSRFLLGEVLEVLDSLIGMTMKLKSDLQSFSLIVQDGPPGPSAPESLDSDECSIKGCILGNHGPGHHWNGSHYFDDNFNIKRPVRDSPQA